MALIPKVTPGRPRKRHRPVFIDIGTQRDFILPDGALPVPEAEQIVPNLAELTRFAVQRRIPILAFVDSHENRNPALDGFPPHCLRGTPGQAKLPATSPDSSQVLDPALMNRQIQQLVAGRLAQAVIEKHGPDIFLAELTAKALAAIAPTAVYIYGVTTEHSIHDAVLGLVDRVPRTHLVLDAVKAIDETAGIKAIEAMTDAGARPTTTQGLIGQLHARQ